MHYVYLLRSEISPAETYVGSTEDLRARLAQHNSGKSIHTNKFKPWTLEAYVAFRDKQLADSFERYLKSGSGRAFIKRHLQPNLTRNLLCVRSGRHESRATLRRDLLVEQR